MKLFNFELLQSVINKLNLVIFTRHQETDKFNQKIIFEIKCCSENCNEKINTSFACLSRHYDNDTQPYCSCHRIQLIKIKSSETMKKKQEKHYEKNREKLFKLTNELGIKLLDNYENMDIINKTLINYQCIYKDCLNCGKKEFGSLINKNLFYCNDHHYLIHNNKINETLREKNKETFEQYNKILEDFKNKLPEINLQWEKNTISRHGKIHFNCINSKCKKNSSKLLQHILISQDDLKEEVFFACEVCKFYISHSLREDRVLLINTSYINELVYEKLENKIQKIIPYITTYCEIMLPWKCGNICMNCNEPHIYIQKPYHRFHSKGTGFCNCPICENSNNCSCIKDGFICFGCKKYFLCRSNCVNTRNICKICYSMRNDENLNKYLTELLIHCKVRCRIRKSERSYFDLDLEYLQNLLIENNMLCYYSKHNLSIKRHSDFKLSLERLDNKKGYIKGNVEFICCEFQNGHRQWSKEKFDKFCKSYNTYQFVSEDDKKLIKIEFNKALPHIKKYTVYNENKENSLAFKLKNLTRTSKSSVKKKNKSKFRLKTPLIHTLTFEELLNIYLYQNGRCKYSNFPMNLNGEYMMSLERIDAKIGYTKDNCCLICLEFNSSTWECAKSEEDDRSGSSGWSQEKVKIVVENYLLNNKIY